MKIGVISDTHLTDEQVNEQGQDLLEILYPHFKEVELIFHAGDLIEWSIISLLENIARVEAVSGNMDRNLAGRFLQAHRVFELNGHRVGLIHGWGPPYGLRDRIRQTFNNSVETIVFGHTHEPFSQIEDGIFYFNPGAAFDRKFTKVNSIGLLDIEQETKGQIIYLT